MMKLNPSQIFRINNTINCAKNNNLKSIPMDTFVRTSSSVSFKGEDVTKPETDFRTWAEKTNFLSSQFKDVITDENNIIGSGFDHTVYAIPNCEDYVLRKNNFGCGMPLDYSGAALSPFEYPKSDINVGQVVATIEIPCTLSKYLKDSVDVLRKQTGHSIGNPPFAAISNEYTGELRTGELPYESRERKEKFLKDIHSVSQLPQKAFDDLISDLTKAAEAGYALDHYNSNNLLLDDKNSRINLIDMRSGLSSKKADYANLLYSLTNIYYLPNFTSMYDGNQMQDWQIKQAVEDIVTIVDKYTTAMQNQGVKFDRENSSIEFRDFMNSMPCSIFCQTGDYSEKWNKFEQMGIA